ncbi:hypothetical protein KCP78_21650 [Salmonella enterica subsp. enterica]|nr:hypothetical protein KCP78_21650 [Salmonella enterica subsp. enterica]
MMSRLSTPTIAMDIAWGRYRCRGRSYYERQRPGFTIGNIIIDSDAHSVDGIRTTYSEEVTLAEHGGQWRFTPDRGRAGRWLYANGRSRG